MKNIKKVIDQNTNQWLLPPQFRLNDNSRRIHHYCIALKNALNKCVTPDQKEQLILHYCHGMKKKDIARLQNKAPSSITKSMRAGEHAIRAYVEQYMQIYDTLEKEWLNEEY